MQSPKSSAERMIQGDLSDFAVTVNLLGGSRTSYNHFMRTATCILRCAATSADGTGSDDHTLHVAPASTADPTLALRLKLDVSD